LLYNIEESAAALNLSPRTVAALLARGELRSITVGRRRLIPREALNAFVAERIAGDPQAGIRDSQ
jgi:excisionase family DNA binding protein